MSVLSLSSFLLFFFFFFFFNDTATTEIYTLSLHDALPIAAGDLFARQAHAQATARISFCIDQILLGVITGDVGAGKTVAVRAAVAGLDPTRHQVIYVANPAFGTRGLHVQVVRALGAQPRYLKAELMAQAADLLAAETAERHRTVVLIVDEAQD